MVRLTGKLLMGVCAALAFTAVSATESGDTTTSAVSDDFESTEADATPAGWTGDGTVAEESYEYNPTVAVGLPLTGETQKHTKFLNVDGSAVRSYKEGSKAGVAGNVVVVDMMVKVAAAEENPSEAPGEGGNIQVAIAAGKATTLTTAGVQSTTVNLFAYIPFGVNDNGTSKYEWWELGPRVTVGSWIRLTLVMDYASNKCRVSVDGKVCGTYGFPGTPATKKTIASVTVDGQTAVDDVVVTPNSSIAEIKPYPDTALETVGEGEAEIGVPLNWCARNGVKSGTLGQSVSDSSGLTYAQKYEAGLGVEAGYAVNDGTKFEVSKMTVEKENASFTVPGKANAYTVVVKDENGNTVSLAPETTSEVADGKTSTIAKVDLSSTKLGNVTGKVLTFQVKASGAAQQVQN